MKKLILSILLTASQAIAGLPPTTTKGQSDASKSTTFDFQAPLSQFTKTSGTAALIETRNFNLLKNPGFEATTFSTNWTASGGTFVVGTSTNIGTGLKGAVFTPSAGSQTVTSDAITIPNGLYGVAAEVSCFFKSSATDYVLSAYNGTSNVTSATISASTNFGPQKIVFTMPTSGTIALRIASASAAAALSIDDCYLGYSEAGANSISSNSASALRMEYAQFGGGASGGLATSACTGSPCTLAANSASWISSVTRSGTGAYSATIAGGVFSSVPYCWGNSGLFGVATGGIANVNATSTTALNINTYANNGSGAADAVVTMYCIGPR